MIVRALVGTLGLGLALALALRPSPAWGNEHRFGLFVGNNEGLPGSPELIFAESDAEKMRDLFVEYGAMDHRDAVLLHGATARAVQHEFEKLSARIQGVVADGHEAFFIFYYSGHGDDDSLHLGTTRIEHVNLRTWLDRTGAQVNMAMVDACQSGGLVRRKGGQRGPAMTFAAPEVESMRGTAILTSSAASELSQESSHIGGGFFTHYLHTALTGGADRNRDGEVSLSEAYDYVYSETAFRTRDTPQTQTPHGDFDLSGAGDVILTHLEEASAHLSFLGTMDGTFSVWDESRKRYVAEVDGGAPLTLAVRPGTFYVHRRMPGWVEEASYAVRRGETRSVLIEDFDVVSYESVASKGDIEKQIRRAKIPDLSIRFVAGFRSFGDRGFASSYISPHAIGGLEARFLSKGRNYWGFDVLTGGGPTELRFSGLDPIRSIQSTTSLSAVVGFNTRPALVRAGLGGRGGLTYTTRDFPGWDTAFQSGTALDVGLNSWAGLHHGRFTGDLQLNWLMMITNWDDNPGWPTYGDLLLVLGYRF